MWTRIIRVLNPLLIMIFITASSAIAADTAVVIVDMQSDYLETKTRITETPQTQALINTQRKLLKWAKDNGIPVIVFEWEGSGRTIRRLRPLIESISQHQFITKRRNGGFDQKIPPSADPVEVLVRWKTRRLIVAGVNGPHCVKDTITGALDLSFEVITSADLVANTTWSDVMPPGIFYPNSDWWFSHPGFKTYETFDEILNSCDEALKKRV